MNGTMYREAKGFVNGELDRRSTAAGQQINASADHLRTIADQLRGDDFARSAAPYVDQGAAALEQVGQYLQNSDGERLLSDAEAFGKERPWAVAAAGFLAGLGISRMVKAGVAEHATGRSNQRGPTTYGGQGYGTKAESPSYPGAGARTGSPSSAGAGAQTGAPPSASPGARPSSPSPATGGRQTTPGSPMPSAGQPAAAPRPTPDVGSGRGSGTPISSDAAALQAKKNAGPTVR